MQKLVNVCDRCDKVIKALNIRDGQELCELCAGSYDSQKRYALSEKNQKFGWTLKGCSKCKGTGYLHKSIYLCGPGYYDEPDPDVFCKCRKGIALNPSTDYDVEKKFNECDDVQDYFSSKKKQSVKDAVLSLIKTRPLLSQEVRESLVKQGYKEKDIRNTICELWDSGHLNVGLDQKLRPTDLK